MRHDAAIEQDRETVPSSIGETLFETALLDQLSAAVHAECATSFPILGMLLLKARLNRNLLVDDFATVRGSSAPRRPGGGD